jgi:hypothetical protein
MSDKPDEQLPFDELQFNSDLFKLVLNADPSGINAMGKLLEYFISDPLIRGLAESGELAKMPSLHQFGLLDAKIDKDSPITGDERDAIRTMTRGWLDLLKPAVEHDIERMGSKLTDAGFPDPRGDYGAWRIIAKMVGCDPDGYMEDIFDSAMAFHASKQQADRIDDGDGLFESDRILVWGGVRFTLRTNQAIVFRLLVDAYPGDVTHGTFEDKGIRVFRDSFRFSSKERKKRGYDYYPCWGVIADGSAKDSKRLIDPSIVRSDPKRFQVPNIIPIDPQGSPE